MRKISKMPTSGLDPHAVDSDLLDTRPRGISGATINSWPGSLDIDCDVLFARSASGPTLTSSVQTTSIPAGHRAAGTVSLSDGTRITFAIADQFDTEELTH